MNGARPQFANRLISMSQPSSRPSMLLRSQHLKSRTTLLEAVVDVEVCKQAPTAAMEPLRHQLAVGRRSYPTVTTIQLRTKLTAATMSRFAEQEAPAARLHNLDPLQTSDLEITKLPSHCTSASRPGDHRLAAANTPSIWKWRAQRAWKLSSPCWCRNRSTPLAWRFVRKARRSVRDLPSGVLSGPVDCRERVGCR
jgi:hypothetical protein